ncbi:DUF6881 domain-containing protein [Gimesia chilikensis]|uniref:DUF6881 domain-containing protein n=1 Tax=Gimesia chilikensis TaxID=2605989 RepID=UPI00396583A3
MEYLKVEWLHRNDEYPILLFSELDEDRMEIRKIEQYRDGKFCFADHGRATGDTKLSFEPLPSIEILSQERSPRNYLSLSALSETKSV